MPQCCGCRPAPRRREIQAGAETVQQRETDRVSQRQSARESATDSGEETDDYFSAEEEFCGHQQLLSDAVASVGDYGVPRVGDVVVGGRWTQLELLPAVGPEFNPDGEAGAGWDQPDPKEVLAMSDAEVRACDRLVAEVGEREWRSLPADLQLAFVRDVYGNPAGVGWRPEEAFDNTVVIMQTCAKWAAEINAFGTHRGPALPREARFTKCAPYEILGADAWGHPRLWATVTGWPPISQEVWNEFSADEVCMLHTKRFLELQHLKREASRRLQRPIALHCCVLAFEPGTAISVGRIKQLFKALQYPSVASGNPDRPDSYTTDQWFFPMTLNAPAIVVNTPWQWRAAYGLAKKFMVAETADKFTIIGSNFLPVLRDNGVPYDEIPRWVIELHTGDSITW